jgi:predicted PurR-regulated permease PerM
MIHNLSDQREFVYRILLIILLVSLALALWSLRGALLLVFLSIILATALSIPVGALKRRGFSHGQAVIISLAAAAFVIALVVVAILPAVVNQVVGLIDELPDAFETAIDNYNELSQDVSFLPRLETEAGRFDDERLSDLLVAQAGSATRQVFPFLGNVGGLLADLLVLVVLTIFLVAEPNLYVEGVLTLVPRAYRPRALEVVIALGKALRLAIYSQILSAFLVGALTTISLSIIGVDDALALGVIAGFFNFVPTFGAIVSMFVAIIFTLASDSSKLVPVIILYLVIQQLESNVITPRMVRQTLHMPGAVVIITQLTATALFGFLGLLMAVPLVAVSMVLVRELYVYDALNSRKAVILKTRLENGQESALVTTDPYRPEQLTPGQAANLLASGQDPFDYVQQHHTIEILGPPPEQMQQVATNQQAVWVAILALVAAQAISLIHSVMADSRKARG